MNHPTPRTRSPLIRARGWLRSMTRRFGFEVCRWPFLVDPLAQHLTQLLRAESIDCVLDVGAHHGEYALYLRNLGYRGRIVSFEPLPENVRLLEERAADDPEWRIVGCALGERAETREIHQTRHDVYSSFLTPNEEAHRFSESGSDVVASIEVPVQTLADCWDECLEGIESSEGEPRVFLKMDTQGFDGAVLEGAKPVLSRIRGLQSEVSVKQLYHGMPDFTESIETYRSLGYAPTGFFPNSQESDLTIVEMDCVLLSTASVPVGETPEVVTAAP